MKLKNKLKNNKLSLGSWVMMKDSISTEILSNVNLDWLVIDYEHTSLSLETIQHHIRNIQNFGLEALVRVSKNEEVIIKKVLDMGADGIVVPMICSKSDAINAVNYAKYPPEGLRGVGLYRAQNYGLQFEKYKKWVDKNLVIIAQIEHIKAVDNLDEILDVNGIDGILIGPYDLSASMGRPGDFNCKIFKQTLNLILKKCKLKKISAGLHVVDTDPKTIKLKIKEGYKFLAYGIDYLFLRDKIIEGINFIKKNQKK